MSSVRMHPERSSSIPAFQRNPTYGQKSLILGASRIRAENWASSGFDTSDQALGSDGP